MTTNQNSVTRRNWILSALAMGGAVAATGMSAPQVQDSSTDEEKPKKGARILFQGDSITDVQRHRKHVGPNNGAALGRGYPFLIASTLLAKFPGSELKCFNRGISGNKVPDLAARWQKEAIDLKPDVLSILVGVNDIWHKLGGGYDGTVKTYEDGFLALIQQTQKALPKTKIVICEPFVLRCGAVGEKWFPEFDERRAAAKRVTKATNCTWIPFQEIFDEATKHAAPSYWAGDGVHPSIAGHALMAKAWVELVKI
ncbi:MAG: lysophospholipase L1-like esterase [Planctomycetota bacterium]